MTDKKQVVRYFASHCDILLVTTRRCSSIISGPANVQLVEYMMRLFRFARLNCKMCWYWKNFAFLKKWADIWSQRRKLCYVVEPASVYFRRTRRRRCLPRTPPLFFYAEPHARVDEAVRLDLQQQVVHRDLDHPLPQQEGSLRGENPQVTLDHLLPRIRRFVNRCPRKRSAITISF